MASYPHDHEDEINLFAETNYRNARRKFGIKTDDRRRHVYVLGKTGMGKTTLLENMILNDIAAGHGVCYVDPHGDTAEKLLNFIPANRINDVVYFNPADLDFPIGFNVLEAVDEASRPLVAQGLMGVFKKIWPDVWSARMEHILNQCILSLLEYPDSTLLGINRILVDKEFRKRVVSQMRDPVVKAFWVDEYARWEDRFRNEAIAPIQNKVGQFLAATIIRNIVAQVKSTINIREIMDEGKILIINLAKGRIGEDSSRLLGGMIITKLQLAAMERVDMAEEERRDFYLYVDEFQNFATASFANILSEARKYRLNLIVAHQYIEQLDEDYVRPAVFGNVGTMIFFRIGAADALFLEQEVAPRFLPEDLTNLTKFEVYIKLMIDGVASEIFSANTLPPINQSTDSAERVIKVSRERYARPRAEVEEKIMRWAGFLGGTESTPQLVAQAPRPAPAFVPTIVSAPAPARPAPVKFVPTLAAKPVVKPVPVKAVKTLINATCSRCKKVMQLTFQPDPSRPYFCDDCFKIVKEERKKAAEIPVEAAPPEPAMNVPLSAISAAKPVAFSASGGQHTSGRPAPGEVVSFDDPQQP
ncbi:MAG: type IV secretion system DNA-binding domain-containing protein [Patescibacteria group bacterium]